LTNITGYLILRHMTKYMERVLALTKALSDETRIRIVMSLTEGELCLCEIIELLSLAPSTVSKHMSILHESGLVKRRKEGRWHYFTLLSDRNDSAAKQAIELITDNLKNSSEILADKKKLLKICRAGRVSATLCYSRKVTEKVSQI